MIKPDDIRWIQRFNNFIVEFEALQNKLGSVDELVRMRS